MIAHVGVSGPAPFVAMGLFFVGAAAAVGAYWISVNTAGVIHRAGVIGLGMAAVACFAVATALPFVIHLRPQYARPSSTARLVIVSPRPGSTFHGDPAAVLVQLRLDGGMIVPTTSNQPVPNKGHVHVYLDGSMLTMTGLSAQIAVSPGRHTLRTDFVATDHGPFRPPVTATVTFDVRP
jgi:hypothetical protein